MVFVDGVLYEPERRRRTATRREGEKADEPTDAEAESRSPCRPGASSPRRPSDKTARHRRRHDPHRRPRRARSTRARSLVRAGKIAAVGRDVAVPAGARVIDAHGPLRDAGDHRRPLPHRDRGRRQRVHRTRSPPRCGSPTSSTTATSTSTASSRAASRPSTCSTARATRSAARTRSSSCAGARRPRRWSSRTRRGASSSPWARTSKRSNFRVPGQQPRYPATRMGVEVVLRERVPGGAGLQARSGRSTTGKLKARGAQGRDRPWRPGKNLQLEKLKDILDGKVFVHAPLLPRRRDPDADPGRRRVRLQGPHLPARPRGLQGRERDRDATAPARRPSSTGGPSRWRPSTRIPYNPAILASPRRARSPSTPTPTSWRGGSTGTPPRR